MTQHTNIDEANTHIEDLQKLVKKLRTQSRESDKDMNRYRVKFFEARDRAELWESRAIRYSNKLNTLNIKNAPKNGQ